MFYLLLYLTVFVFTISRSKTKQNVKRPNIIFIMADDLGYDDVQFQSHQIETPNIDKLRKNGQFMEWYYAQTVCSPSRSALLTGLYPMHTGIWDVITPSESVSVPFEFTLFPEILYDNGYATHLVGKWHLGFYKWRATPTFRGFQSFFGYYSGAEGYYSHVNGYYDFHDAQGIECGQNCSQVSIDSYNNYSTFLFTDRAIDIVRNHSKSDDNPLFLYLAYQAVHNPEEVPQSYVNAYNDTIDNYTRRVFAGMLSCMDEGIGNLSNVLQEYGYLDEENGNTIIVFSSDNGGPVPQWTGGATGTSNYPLRGGKMSVFEGGVRVTAFFYATADVLGGKEKYQQLANTNYTNLFHISDWFPTFLEAANIDINEQKSLLNYSLDGVSQWKGLISNSSLNHNFDPFFEYRDTIYYGYDMSPKFEYDALRLRWYKIINGSSGGYPTGWYPPPPEPKNVNYGKYGAYEDCNYRSMCCNGGEYFMVDENVDIDEYGYAYDGPFLLFNLSSDPYEYENVANNSAYAKIFSDTLQALIEIESTRRPLVQNDESCPNITNPVYPVVGKVWMPWC